MMTRKYAEDMRNLNIEINENKCSFLLGSLEVCRNDAQSIIALSFSS